ncbi:hypothetical protein M011DRAFT_436314 [Sporormia fimetaria CBS 119925]|uniref:SPRY domain-containing protein n=1 Tax=Sporormia fimetaria CBS 119925 TaxID=1340428 RepID=A0A6A6VL43_9PLEO|nr:hypothetical protein M011DRAFT_436314 [Sporormia fimetaria CBS 119925]
MFRKLKEKLKGEDRGSSSNTSQQHQPQVGPSQNAPTHHHTSYSSKKDHPPSEPPSSATYAPPPGPPPNHPSSATLGSPPGPPPNYSSSSTTYAPPPGPPPNRPQPSSTSSSQFPQQPPPTWSPPPYHDWTVIPDTALLPPPPSLGYNDSPSANSTYTDYQRALTWTNAHPLWPPQNLTPAQHTAIQSGALALLKPPTYIGDLLPQPRPGHWKCRTHASTPDSSLLTNLPAYSVLHDSPLHTKASKTIYFEVKITGIGRGEAFTFSEADAGLAIGFIAPPYPTFRLPGWHRGSLAIHGDDGRKYVNDGYGGVDFTTAFKPGDVVGIGIMFSLPRNPPGYDAQAQGGEAKMLDIEGFFTRNGKKEGRWDGNEELDERSMGGAMGLKGERDLFPAIGVFGGVDFEVFFGREEWLFDPFSANE